MTASRAHRRGPSPSLAPDVHAPEHDARSAAHDVRAADAHAPAGRALSADPAAIPVSPVSALTPGTPMTPAMPVLSASEAHLLRTTVPAQPSRAAGVRGMLAEYLTHLGLSPDHLDNAVLAADELFVNAVRHGSPDPGGTITVTVEYTERELRVTVADRSPALPRLRTADGAEESGRGLAIVAALSDDWGIAQADPGSTGKKVWFALMLRGMP